MIASVSEKNRTNKLCVAQLRGCSLMALGTQGTAAILNPDTMSDTGSGTSSGSDEEGPRERHQAPSKGENGDDPLALFSACVSAWNSGEGEKPESAEETGGEVKRVRKDRRIHRTAEERKQVSMRPPQPTCTHHNLTFAAPLCPAAAARDEPTRSQARILPAPGEGERDEGRERSAEDAGGEIWCVRTPRQPPTPVKMFRRHHPTTRCALS